jgi:hypothetical protein
VVAAIQDREFAPRRLVPFGQMRDRTGDAFGFVLVVAAFEHADRRAFALLAPQALLEEMAVVRDDLVRATQDAPRAAVILFELDHAQLREIAREFVEVLGFAPRQA